jgi:hypothetical protein
MFIRHPVADFAAWRKTYDTFDKARRAMGVSGHAVFQTAGDPNDVTVWHDFETLDSAQSFAKSQTLASVMKDAGVVGKPTIWLTKQS